MVVAVFWAFGTLVVYAYVLYPVVVWLCASTFGRDRAAPAVADADLPTLSLLIAAHNEEAEIEKRIQSATMTDYPPDKLEVVIASDGSTDATAEIVGRYVHRGVPGVAGSIRLLDYHPRRGKAAVLNAAFAGVAGDVVVLSDANTQMDPQAPRTLARWFADPAVGAVCGKLVLTDPETGRNVDGMYWKYETFIKKCEGRLGALLGANGGIYAIRRELFTGIPPTTIVDDFVIPLRAKLQTGCAIVYDSRAVAYEETPQAIGAEFHRRSRIGAGGFQSICMLWRLLHPRHGWTAFAFLSHKVLRWLCPFFLLGMLAANVLLVPDPVYGPLLAGQVAFYLMSGAAALTPARARFLRPLRLATMFTSMNAALLVGFFRWLRGTQKAAWVRTARLAEVEG